PGDPRLVAYYIGKPGIAADAAELRRALSESLPEYMVPSHFVEMAAFPLTANAKIDRKALPAPEAISRPKKAEFESPTDDVESAIAGVWQKLLGLDQVGATDNFFEIGGHSLLAVRAHRELRENLGMELSITDIFRFPTARRLREFLVGSASPGEGSAEHVTRANARLDAAARRAEARRVRRRPG
ncbi:MAG TPA: phosphopantetheine-binding protein, partial [Polyangiaceae bacterium]